MSKPLSAIDCITPAIERTKKQLFAPFRLKRWLRLALVCLTTGEFAGGGGGGGGNFSSLIPRHKHDSDSSAFLPDFDWGTLLHWLPWIIAGIFLLFVLFLLFLYVASVFRFVLFDSVLRDRCELKGSWGRWERHGRSYFFWSIGFMFVSSLALGILIGLPILVAWQLGLFHHPDEHIAALVMGGIGLFLLFIAYCIVSAVIGLFAKDFCVPIMALDEVGVIDAWQRLLPIVAAEKWKFTVYVLMKIVLAIATAILAGIITLVVILVSLIPLGIGGVALYFVGKALGLIWDWKTMCLLAALGGILLMIFLYILAIISTPFMVFFQSYVIHFIGARYRPLGDIVYPPPPEPPPVPPEAPPTLLSPPLPNPAG